MLLRQAPIVSALSPASHRSRQRQALAAGCLGAALLLSACGKGDAPAAPPGGGMPPPEVGVVVAKPGDVGLITELPGRLEASRVAQVRARAAGILQKRLFREGSDVKAGQPLFTIDSAPYAAALQSAAGHAGTRPGQPDARRPRWPSATSPWWPPMPSASRNMPTPWRRKSRPRPMSPQARRPVQTGRINLNYASVTAPISGRIGRALVTEGALVGQGEATQLAVIQQIDPVYVNFTQSAGEVMKLRRALADGQLQRAGGSEAASVRLVLEDGSEYARPGKLLFSDLTVDASTGQITLRAEVPNPKGDLLPGLYVRVRLEQAQVANAITAAPAGGDTYPAGRPRSWWWAPTASPARAW
ncbi:MAG: efflux RND transporter periplasmic adaptor subunit [Giesbergeria sp.]